jgi:hypothetical protein
MTCNQVLELLTDKMLKDIKNKCKDEKLSSLISTHIKLRQHLQSLKISQIKKGEIVKAFPDITELKSMKLDDIIDKYRENI